MIFAGIFAIAVGILMILQWTVTIMRGQVAGPEAGMVGRGKTEMGFHWIAEFATAALLLVSGIALIAAAGWGKAAFLVGDGMLIYTVINSPGYFAQQRKWGMVVMFAVILGLAITGIVLILP